MYSSFLKYLLLTLSALLLYIYSYLFRVHKNNIQEPKPRYAELLQYLSKYDPLQHINIIQCDRTNMDRALLDKISTSDKSIQINPQELSRMMLFKIFFKRHLLLQTKPDILSETEYNNIITEATKMYNIYGRAILDHGSKIIIPDMYEHRGNTKVEDISQDDLDINKKLWCSSINSI